MSIAACGTGDDGGGDQPVVVATTTILGDVVSHLVGDGVEVETIMPPNADPHEFQPSARQVQELRQADLVVANGAGFEGGLEDAVDAAKEDGVPVLEAIDTVPHLSFEGGVDPHFFTDPASMATAAEALTAELGDRIPALDSAAARRRAEDYVAELRALDAEVDDTLSVIPDDRRVLVTNHESLGYFAERYGFDVLGVIIPGGSTLAEPSAGDLDDLASAIEEAGVPAVFADTSSPEQLAEALADEVGGTIEVVELYTESLGGEGSAAATYVDMIRTDAQRIADALDG
jgi:zinc/manganese transport system substrate-binding protein